MRKASFRSVEFVHEQRDSNTDTQRIARSSIHAEFGQHVWFLTPHDGVGNPPS